MDPKVYGKLLTTHRRGYGDDVEALRGGFPLRQGARTGLDWLSVATEASGGGTPDLISVLEVLGYVGIYG